MTNLRGPAIVRGLLPFCPADRIAIPQCACGIYSLDLYRAIAGDPMSDSSVNTSGTDRPLTTAELEALWLEAKREVDEGRVDPLSPELLKQLQPSLDALSTILGKSNDRGDKNGKV
jgi:hypothetical protein